MRVVDYIVDRLYKEGAKDIFMLTGGGMMFLSDAVAVHPKMKALCNHHEQACSMAAVGYAKYTEGIGVCFTSTGCGSTNAMTGLLDAWQDNLPVVFVSGQVKRKETTHNSDIPLRQIGTQEANIIELVQPITKYSVMVNEPNEIAYHLEKALYLARTGRPGPVWLDIPMDVQGADVNLKTAKKFNPSELKSDYQTVPDKKSISQLEKMIKEAKRPVLIAGQGVRLSGALKEFREFSKKYKIPVVSPYLGIGTLPTADKSYIGTIGTKGSRAGNLAMQNSDLLIVLGSRLSVTAIGYEYELFAREAKKVVVDIDPVEHKKPIVKIDLFINADIKEFLDRFKPSVIGMEQSWTKICLDWKTRYPVCLPEYRKYKGKISMYNLVDTLSRLMDDKAVVVSDAGSAFYVTSQAVNLRGRQRYLTSGGQADMGFTLPAAIGAAVGKKGEVFGITGDGSFQLNIQELQTIVHNQLPVKIFILNNNGYLSIRATQNKFFEGRLIGTGPESGVSMPNFKKIADAYGIKYFKFKDSNKLETELKKALAFKGPALCEVICPPNELVVPAVSSLKRPDGKMVSRPLEDMLPFLDRGEYRKNMIVKPVDE
ncbi:thiamine pyrophosphate-binding protein [Candidatus Nomurabacteria bacterium]|nr:thiamine pyrophosphate-binding protein [Candidatus Nomurabacteria bacterium]